MSSMKPVATRRRLGRLEVSAIGLGAPIYAEPSEDAVVPVLHRALDRGVDLVDSSGVYWHGVLCQKRRELREQDPRRPLP